MGANSPGKPPNLSVDELDAGWDDEPVVLPPTRRVSPKSQPSAAENQALGQPAESEPEPEPKPSSRSSVAPVSAGRSAAVTTEPLPLPSVAAAPRTLEPWAQQSDRIDRSLSPRQSLSVRSLLTYVGLAAALVLMLGSIALLTRSGEPGEPASKPPPPAPDSLAMTPPATALDPEMSRDASAKPEADPREAAAPKAGALEPGAAEPGAAELAPEADTSPDAPVAVASSIPASPGGRVTVTIRTSPPSAIIYDEKQRIGKGVARINMQAGRKRSMLALLNLHHPRHFVLDGSETTVNITLERMDANAIARAIAVQKHKATYGAAPTKRSAR